VLVTGVTAEEVQPCTNQSEVGEPENDGTTVQHDHGYAGVEGSLVEDLEADGADTVSMQDEANHL